MQTRHLTMACLHSYSEFVMLVCAVPQSGDPLMDDLREAVLYTLHIQDDVIVALVILFFIFRTSGEKKGNFSIPSISVIQRWWCFDIKTSAQLHISRLIT